MDTKVKDCCATDPEDFTGASKILRSCISLPLPEKALREISFDARDYALLHGAGMRYKDNYSISTLSMAPFFLFPTPYPRRDFEKVMKLQPLINKLMYKVAKDHTFLEKCLSNTIKVDDFTKKLWDIYLKVRKEGIKQPVTLGLLRSDVMLTECKPGYCTLCMLPPFVMNQQVEINTIASGFGHMGPISAEIQKYVLRRIGRHDLVQQLPPNDALEGLCGAMIAAWDHYNSAKAIILFVVEDITYNICDQRFHEYEIMRQRPTLKVLRRSLTQIYETARLDDQARLWVGDMEVAVVYYRSGYDPSLYHGPNEWDARLTVERSMAIKCPSVEYHLAGTKKVQQELAVKGALLQFLDPDEAKEVSGLFTGLYTLDMGAEGDETVKKAMEKPENYVLKPQREGGGNNVYGEDIKQELARIGNTSEREAYILMDRIRPPIQQNYLIRPTAEEGTAELIQVVSELGIFGAVLASPSAIYLNTVCGHMLRSKIATNNEGGVHSGNGALDSVLLVD